MIRVFEVFSYFDTAGLNDGEGGLLAKVCFSFFYLYKGKFDMHM